jgi:WD40 repeat protein
MTLHKVKVQALAFSDDETLLASIGGQDDNNVTIWDVETGKPLCGAVSPNLGTCLLFYHGDHKFLLTGGKYLMRLWEIDFEARKLIPTDFRMGQMKRIISCLAIDDEDQYAYCGTTSGDVLCIQLQGPKNYKFAGPKTPINKGVTSLGFTMEGHLIAGGGDGSVNILSRGNLLKIVSKKLLGGVTSVSPCGNGYLCGTSESVIYHMNGRDLEASLITTCHSERINDVAYPEGTCEIIATCSMSDIRLWNTIKGRELLRIRVDNLECNCVCFSPDGKSIVSGWSDGRIRAFGPQSGKLLYVINDAHKITGAKKISGALMGVTALSLTSNGNRILSGGSDGQVRVWQITPSAQSLVASMKEHKATVNSIHIKRDNSACVTASDDGSCIVWSLEKFVRQNIMYAQTYFKQARYLNDESQIVTTGSDKQITYWDAYDCSAIRELQESEKGEINALDLAPDGQYFASGGLDKHVNLWHYDDGQISKRGIGHSGSITKIKFSPDSRFITSVGGEGAIFIWRYRS